MKLFIDTNIILHFKPLDQVDWKEVCGQKNVEILFAPIVIDELDKQRRNPNSRISKRARSVIRKIADIGLEGNWSDNVYIKVIINRPVNSTYASNALDKDEQDDRLLASIIDYKDSGDTNVKLVTNDLGLRLKCPSFGIDKLSLPDKYELKDEVDDLVKENNKLREEVNKYRLSKPKLKLLFDNYKIFEKIKLKEFNFSEFKTEEISKIKNAYPFMEIPHNGNFKWAFNPLINEKSALNYNEKLSNYFFEYEDYLMECETYFRNLFLTRIIKFKLFNNGSIPADDIDVMLHFPDGFTLNDSKPKNTIEEPRPPFKPGEAFRLNPDILSPFERPIIDSLPFTGKGSPSIKKTNSYDVAFDLDNLKHNQDYTFDELYLTFDSYDNATGFTVNYKIYAANIPEVISGQLNVIIEKE